MASIQDYAQYINQKLIPQGKYFNVEGQDEQGMLQYYVDNNIPLDAAFTDATTKTSKGTWDAAKPSYVQDASKFSGNSTFQQLSSGYSTGAFGIPQPPTPQPPDITKYLDIASKQVSPAFQDVVTATQQAGQTQAAGFQKLAADEGQQITILQKTYGDLAASLKSQEDIAVSAQQEAGAAEQETMKEREGSASAALAASGVDPAAQGSFRAPLTAAENATQAVAQENANKVAKIASDYGIKEAQVADTLTANLQQIQQQIDQYTQAGNQAMADTLTKVASLKYDQQQQITSLAQQMAAAQSQYQQQAWKDYMDQVKAAHDEATLNLMMQKEQDAQVKQQEQFQYEMGRLDIQQQQEQVSQQRADIAQQQADTATAREEAYAARIDALDAKIGSAQTSKDEKSALTTEKNMATDVNKYVDQFHSGKLDSSVSREDIIREIANKYYGSTDAQGNPIPDDTINRAIADEVYSQIRSPGEAPYGGLPPDWKLSS